MEDSDGSASDFGLDPSEWPEWFDCDDFESEICNTNWTEWKYDEDKREYCINILTYGGGPAGGYRVYENGTLYLWHRDASFGYLGEVLTRMGGGLLFHFDDHNIPFVYNQRLGKMTMDEMMTLLPDGELVICEDMVRLVFEYADNYPTPIAITEEEMMESLFHWCGDPPEPVRYFGRLYEANQVSVITSEEEIDVEETGEPIGLRISDSTYLVVSPFEDVDEEVLYLNVWGNTDVSEKYEVSSEPHRKYIFKNFNAWMMEFVFTSDRPPKKDDFVFPCLEVEDGTVKFLLWSDGCFPTYREKELECHWMDMEGEELEATEFGCP